MEHRPAPLPLEYASLPRRWGGRWVATAEIAAIVAAIGAGGAWITLADDLLRDSRGWQTNDALVLFSCAGALASVVSLICFVVGRCLIRRAIGWRAMIAIVVDVLALAMFGVWLAKSLA